MTSEGSSTPDVPKAVRRALSASDGGFRVAVVLVGVPLAAVIVFCRAVSQLSKLVAVSAYRVLERFVIDRRP